MCVEARGRFAHRRRESVAQRGLVLEGFPYNRTIKAQAGPTAPTTLASTRARYLRFT